IQSRLVAALQAQMGNDENSQLVGEMIINWLDRNLPQRTLLVRDAAASTAEAQKAEAAVPESMRHYKAGEDQLAAGGVPIDATSLALLREEHRAWLKHRGIGPQVRHSLATFGLY